MLIDDFLLDENLYRSIKKNNPDLWKAEENRPSSAAFKDSKGLSVDRQGNRTHEEACTSIANRLQPKAVVYFTVAACNACQARAFPDILPDNPYHCLIKNIDGEIKLSKSTPGLLARMAKVCYQAE